MSHGNSASLLCNLEHINSIAFDFDGTLVNCKTRQVEVLNSILRSSEFNILKFNTDQWWKYKTNGLSTIDALIKMHIKPETANDINSYWYNIIENPEWLDLDYLYENVIPFFQRLKELNVKLYIITARKSKYFFLNQIRKLIPDNFITKYFVVNPSNSIEQKKEILNFLKPSIFVGDTENDFFSAQKAGVDFIATSSGQRSKQFLSDIGIPSIADNFLILMKKVLMMIEQRNYIIHPSSEVQTENIGEGTCIWQYCVVLKNAIIGKNCNINFNVFIENDVIIGDNVTIKSGVQIWDGIRIMDNAFISPNVTFTNDLVPRSKIFPEKFLITTIEEGASIGANSTIIGGICIGKYAMVGAGSLVNKNIPDHTLYYGSPAVFKANICKCGSKLDNLLRCTSCSKIYNIVNGQIEEK